MLWFLVFRELLQNSADSGSKAVQVHFETQGYLDQQKEKVPLSEDWRIPDFKTTLVWLISGHVIEFR